MHTSSPPKQQTTNHSLSAWLSVFMGVNHATKQQVSQRVWAHIKQHKLLQPNPSGGAPLVYLDDTLAGLFRVDKGTPIPFDSIEGRLAPLMSAPQPCAISYKIRCVRSWGAEWGCMGGCGGGTHTVHIHNGTCPCPCTYTPPFCIPTLCHSLHNIHVHLPCCIPKPPHMLQHTTIQRLLMTP